MALGLIPQTLNGSVLLFPMRYTDGTVERVVLYKLRASRYP